MKPRWKIWAWRLAKLVLAAAILGGVARQFYRDLQSEELEQLHWRTGWLVVSALLYLGALTFSALFWRRLLHVFGERPSLFAALRAYFIGHLGKYVPGKAWALLLRGVLVRGPDVRLGVAIITAFYEVLTTMAAGALIAAVVFLFDPPHAPDLEWHPVLTGLLLLGLCGLPLLPWVFNFLTARTAARFQKIADFNLPRLRASVLAQGLALTGVGWALMGLSVWSALQAVLPEPPELSLAVWGQCCGAIGLAYVAGFLAFMLPSGVGVREYFLRYLLAFAGPPALIVAAVLLLRLVWTTAELLVAGLLFPWSPKSRDQFTVSRPEEAAPRV